jgi:hypothetical protein
MFGILDLTWKPSATSTSPPAGKAPAVIRNDPYTHGIVVAGGWATLGAENFDAQIRAARLTGATAGAALADFTVVNERGVYNDAVVPPTFTETVDGPDLRIVISLTAVLTTALPVQGTSTWYWDVQQVDGSTLLAGKVKMLDDVTRVA